MLSGPPLDLFKLGMTHAWRFYSFLCRLSILDVEQEVHMAILQSNGKSMNAFNCQVQRNLYHLAKSFGFRKTNPWCKRSKDTGTARWIKPVCSFSEIDLKEL